MLTPYLSRCPLVAILRGISPEDVLPVVDLLANLGFTIVEVPLNSPDALESIRLISKKFGRAMLVGAGTVTNTDQVRQVAAAGGRLVVSPNSDPGVIQHTKQREMVSIPGCVTPTEVFSALKSGADAIKLFPACMISPRGVKALRAVLPPVPLLVVGGIAAADFSAYLAAGADGFGTGSGLYRPGISLSEIEYSAREMIATINSRTSGTELMTT